MMVAAYPVTEGSARGFQWDSQGASSCRQDGGLGCPGLGCPASRPAGGHDHLPWWQINASLPLPLCIPPVPHTTSVAAREVPLGDAPGGAGTQVPVTCSQRQLGERRMQRESGLIPLIPFPCLPVGGPGPCKRVNAFLKATAVCKANQVESLKLLETPFKRKKKKKEN